MSFIFKVSGHVLSRLEYYDRLERICPARASAECGYKGIHELLYRGYVHMHAGYGCKNSNELPEQNAIQKSIIMARWRYAGTAKMRVSLADQTSLFGLRPPDSEWFSSFGKVSRTEILYTACCSGKTRR